MLEQLDLSAEEIVVFSKLCFNALLFTLTTNVNTFLMNMNT